MLPSSIATLPAALLQSGLVPRGTRVEVFSRIFEVFLALGTLVGIVVVAYMLYNAYKYRARGRETDGGKDDVDPPTLGELPTGGGGGRKLFLSFALSAIIVVSLITWTYVTLLYVEGNTTVSAESPTEGMEITVTGYQFGWDFEYPNGHVAQGGPLRGPVGAEIQLRVTSRDVFHNFGIPEARVKSDAIPGQTTETWFVAEETGTYTARCYELCGAAHSHMTAEVIVMEKDEFSQWYANTTEESSQQRSADLRPVAEAGAAPGAVSVR